MPKDVLVSVVIRTTGTLNKLKLLRKTLESLSRQTWKDFELIIATESNADIIKNLVESLGVNATVISTGFWNRCKTANLGIRASKGKYVVILDDDLYLDREFLRTLLKTIEIAPARVGHVTCPFKYLKKTEYKGLSCILAKLFGALNVKNFLLKRSRPINAMLVEGIYFGGTKALFKREALFKAGLFDESMSEIMLGEDFDLAVRVYKCGFTGLLNNSCRVYHLETYYYKHGNLKLREYESYCSMGTYAVVKHRDIIGIYVFFHLVYLMIWGLVWALRRKSIRIFLYCARGIVGGIIKGLQVKLTHDRELPKFD